LHQHILQVAQQEHFHRLICGYLPRLFGYLRVPTDEQVIDVGIVPPAAVSNPDLGDLQLTLQLRYGRIKLTRDRSTPCQARLDPQVRRWHGSFFEQHLIDVACSYR